MLAAAWWAAHEWWNPVLANLIGIVVGAYLAHCTIKPRARCPVCGGTGRLFESKSKRHSFMNCPNCQGRGRRVRWGARIWPRNRELYPRR